MQLQSGYSDKNDQDAPYSLNRLRCSHMIRNLTIRNRDTRRLIVLNFPLRVKEPVNSDCRVGFLVKNCIYIYIYICMYIYIYSQLDMSRILDVDQKIRNFKTLAPKNTISYHTSPPCTYAEHVLLVELCRCYVKHRVQKLRFNTWIEGPGRFKEVGGV